MAEGTTPLSQATGARQMATAQEAGHLRPRLGQDCGYWAVTCNVTGWGGAGRGGAWHQCNVHPGTGPLAALPLVCVQVHPKPGYQLLPALGPRA